MDYYKLYQQAFTAKLIPTVLFTDRTKWRKDVIRKLETKLNNRLFLHFEYQFFKLFDFNAQDFYNINNPVVKILLPKMNKQDKRIEVIRTRPFLQIKGRFNGS